MDSPLIHSALTNLSSFPGRLPRQGRLVLFAAALATVATGSLRELGWVGERGDLPSMGATPAVAGALLPAAPAQSVFFPSTLRAKTDRTPVISKYDKLIRAEAESVGLDWRLVAAVICQESRFDPNAVSSAGAVGLMQIMPFTTGEDAQALTDPVTNVRVGVRRLRSIWDGYAVADSLDRWQLTLATYHAGEGRITAARAVAVKAGWDPDEWVGGVSRGLIRLAQDWNSLDGKGFPGRATVTYVRSVLNRYRDYSRLTSGMTPAAAARADSIAAVRHKLER
jgi:hypothetical protein